MGSPVRNDIRSNDDHGRAMSRRRFLATGGAGLLGVGAAGCLPDDSALFGPQFDPAHLTVNRRSPTIEPETGKTPLGIDNVGRDGYLYVPESYDPETPAPLLVALHGRGMDVDGWGVFFDDCDAAGMIMLAPESRDRSWDLTITGSFGPDVIFLSLALDHVIQRCNIDTGRIVLMGISDGGTYALSLGVSNGDFFTHIISVAPGFLQPGRELRGNPLVWLAHGLSDPVFDEEYTHREILPELRDMDLIVQYVQFEGGHEFPPAVQDQAMEWLLP